MKPHFSKKNNALQSGNSDEPVKNEEKYATVLPDELFKKIKQKSLTIVDIRDAENFASEHIADSINIPPELFSEKLNLLDNSREYVIVDDFGSSPQELQVLDFLSGQDFKNIGYLGGGLSAWKGKFYSTVTPGDPTSFSDQAKVSYLKSEELKKILAEETGLFIVDLRSEKNYKEGHIDGAINIFLDDLEQKRREIPYGKKIILYDNDGLWAFQGAVRLFDMGTLNVFALSDGINAWKQKGFALVK